MNTLTLLRDQDGDMIAPNTIYVTSTGDGRKSLCSAVAAGDMKPYILNPIDPSISLFSVPDGVDAGASTRQTFISTFIHPNGDQYFYYSTDSLLAIIYMNIWHEGSWVYAQSQKAIDYTGIAEGSIAVMDVIRRNTPVFYNTQNSTYYQYVMYLVNQTGHWFPPVDGIQTAGIISVAFSHDGVTWVGPYDANNPPPDGDCSDAICVEEGGVMFDGTTLYIIAVEGDLILLQNHLNPPMGASSLTYLFTASKNDPLSLTAYNGKAPISNNGVFAPNMAGYGENHKIFLNASITHDYDSGRLYLSRGYPYPADYTGANGIPCGSLIGCAVGLQTYANRAQLYYLDLGVPMNLALLYSGTWTLVGDWGYEQGFRSTN